MVGEKSELSVLAYYDEFIVIENMIMELKAASIFYTSNFHEFIVTEILGLTIQITRVFPAQPTRYI